MPLTLATFDNGVANGRRIVAVRVDAIDTLDPHYAVLVVNPASIALEDAGNGAEVVAVPVSGPFATLFLILGVLLLGAAAHRPRQQRRA